MAAVLLPVVMLIVAGCGSKAAGSPPTVSLATLVQKPEHWQGKRVQIRAQLLRFTDPNGTTYGVLQDDHQDRIGVKNIVPWKALVGRAVVAQGTVEFDKSFGWYLKAPALRGASP